MKDQIILTAKDEEILNLRRSGETTKSISKKVFLCEDAVKKRLQKLRLKAGVKNDIELINFCHQNGLFSIKAV